MTYFSLRDVFKTPAGLRTRGERRGACAGSVIKSKHERGRGCVRGEGGEVESYKRVGVPVVIVYRREGVCRTVSEVSGAHSEGWSSCVEIVYWGRG